MVNLTQGDKLVLIVNSDSEIHYSGSSYDRIANNASPNQFLGIASIPGTAILYNCVSRSGSEVKYITLYNNSSTESTLQLAIQNGSSTLIIATATIQPNTCEYLSKYDIVNRDAFINLSALSKLIISTDASCDLNYTISLFNYGKNTVGKPLQNNGSIKVEGKTNVVQGSNPAGTGVEYISLQNNDNINSIDFYLAINAGGQDVVIKSFSLGAGASIYIDRNTVKPVQSSPSGSVSWSDITGKPTSTPSQIDTAVTNSHTHTNKSLLDTYTQTNADISDAVSKKHSHSNKPVLDDLSDSGGQLMYDGVLVSDVTQEDSIINALIFG